MAPSTIASYQPGGTAYSTAVTLYGQAAANTLASAAATGDQTQLTNAIANIRGDGGVQTTSTTAILGNQLYNDPLGAPLAQAGTIASNTATALGNATKSVLGSALGNWGMWIVGGVVLLGLFIYFGGGNVVRRKLA